MATPIGTQLRNAVARYEKNKGRPGEEELLLASIRVIADGCDAIFSVFDKPPLVWFKPKQKAGV